MDPKMNCTVPQILNYSIAGHSLSIHDCCGLELSENMENFHPFLTSGPAAPGILDIVIQDTLDFGKDFGNRILLSDISEIWDARFRFEIINGFYLTSILDELGGVGWRMLSNSDFSRSWISPGPKDRFNYTKLSWLIMISFGQTVLAHRTLLLHASVVMGNGRAFAFLGRSGMGKSTHSRMWLREFKEFELLNDDNPAVRIHGDGKVMVYGTPWSGKTACYKPIGTELLGVVRLSQAKKNNFRQIEGTSAFLSMLPSASAIRWDREIFDRMLILVQEITKKVRSGHLECLPDVHSARLCHNSFHKSGIGAIL